MDTTLKAKFSDGVLKPLECLNLHEGEEVTVTVHSAPTTSDDDWVEKTAGGWVGLVDGEKLKRDIYASRLVSSRPIQLV